MSGSFIKTAGPTSSIGTLFIRESPMQASCDLLETLGDSDANTHHNLEVALPYFILFNLAFFAAAL